MTMEHRSIIAAAAAAVCLASSGAAGAADGTAPQAVGCELIRDVAQLQAIRKNPAGNYCLANDIDASSVGNFVPVRGRFTGKFFGNNYAIHNLTINQPNLGAVGLFRRIADNAAIQDLRLVNVNVTGGRRTGALVGLAEGAVTISNVHVSGQVACVTANCSAGGIAGGLEACPCDAPTLIDSSSSAAVAGVSKVGGAVGVSFGAIVSRVIATGPVACLAVDACAAGGLIGVTEDGLVDRAAATGTVDATLPNSGEAGGLVGRLQGFFTLVQYSYSSGAVSGAQAVTVGGLAGSNLAAAIMQSLSVGQVNGTSLVGGLVGSDSGGFVVDSYFDTLTSQQSGSAGGTGLSTFALRGALPVGFDSNWAITGNRSYPYINDSQIEFTPALATLVRKHGIFTFLPISQFDDSQYETPPANADAAALATVYTMVARANGTTRKIPVLADIKIDVNYWNDATQGTHWRGPVTRWATLGALTDIPAIDPLANGNVIGQLKLGNLVILRGSVPSGAGSVTHWMLATLFTRDSKGRIAAIVAHDPWTGAQVMIDPISKTIVSADFPLAGFTVDGYQPVTLK